MSPIVNAFGYRADESFVASTERSADDEETSERDALDFGG